MKSQRKIDKLEKIRDSDMFSTRNGCCLRKDGKGDTRAIKILSWSWKLHHPEVKRTHGLLTENLVFSIHSVVWFELGSQRRVSIVLDGCLCIWRKLTLIMIRALKWKKKIKNQYISVLHFKSRGNDVSRRKMNFFYFFLAISTLTIIFLKLKKKRTKESFLRVKLIGKERGVFLRRNTSPKVRRTC